MRRHFHDGVKFGNRLRAEHGLDHEDVALCASTTYAELEAGFLQPDSQLAGGTVLGTALNLDLVPLTAEPKHSLARGLNARLVGIAKGTRISWRSTGPPVIKCDRPGRSHVGSEVQTNSTFACVQLRARHV